jgi:hypothetical protein
MVKISPQSLLFTLADLDEAYDWLCDIRKDYSPNSDVWNLRRNWEHLKYSLLNQLNTGTYEFGLIDRYEYDDAIISLWNSQDMIALKLITQALYQRISPYLPKSCYHVKGHGGLKKAVVHTYEVLPQYKYVMRTDIKGYYDSINFNVVFTIIESYVKHPVLLKLLRKACHRTETTGGHFYEYHHKGMPKGSPLSPLMGAIALMPFDQAMEQKQDIFYVRYMDDWLVLTKTKTALRKIIKLTHHFMNVLHFQLHPMKTFIGKICQGFNFLAYYMDHQKILPSKETIRRFFERATVLYEQAHLPRRYKKNLPERDISEYQVNEVAPTDAYFQEVLGTLSTMATTKPVLQAPLRRYLNQWACWLRFGLLSLPAYLSFVGTHLPSLFSCWDLRSATLLA